MQEISIKRIKEIWNHAGFQKYFKNTGWMFGGRIFALIMSFFIGAYTARYLGPANYGLLNYIISFVWLFGFLTSFGIDGIVSREIIKNHNIKDKIIGTSFFLKLIGSIFTIIIIAITTFFTTSDTFTILLILLFSLNYIPQAFNILEIYFQSQVLSKHVVIAQISATIIATVLKILVILLNKGIFWLTLIYIIESSLFALFLLITFKYYSHHFRDWRFDKQIAWLLLKDSWPLMLSGLAIGIYMKIDQVMIKNMLGNEQAGIYAVAVKISEVCYFIPGIICVSVFPAIVKSMNINKELFKSRLKKLYFFMFWISFVIASLTTLFSYHIINILFGSEYISSVIVLQIYVWAGIAVFLRVALDQYLLANNLTKISFYNTLLGAVVNIILNIILIPKIGINGAAIATLISYTLAMFGVFIFKESRSQGLIILKSIINYK